GVIAAFSGFFLAWVITDVISFGDYFNMQFLTFFYLTEPPGYPPIEKNPMVVIYSFYQLCLAIDRMLLVAGIHYVLLAATLILLSIGIYGLYKIEQTNKICIVSLVLGFIAAFFILVTPITNLISMRGFPVYLVLMMYAFTQIGLPFSTNIGLYYGSAVAISNMIMLVILFLFGLSLNSVKWATFDPDKAKGTAILLILSGVSFLVSTLLIQMAYSYAVPSILLAVTCGLLIYLFHGTRLLG
ncbi:MAG: hypothetical protein QW279_02665, partial [Candidatus Jordarchaeaceae archaeon]